MAAFESTGARVPRTADTSSLPVSSALSVAEGVFYPNTFNRHPELGTLLAELGADPGAGTRREVDLSPEERFALAQDQE